MEMATAEAIRKQIPASEVFISSPFPEIDSDFYHPIPTIWCSRRRLILASWKLMMLLIWLFFKSVFRLDLKFLVSNTELQHYLNCDAVIDLSGDMLTEDYGVHVAYSHYLPLLKALIAQKPLFLCAQSIGPFRATKFLARYIMNKATFVTVRDPISKDYLEKIGVNQSHVEQTADMAFLLEPSGPARVQEILASENIDMSKGPVLGISLSNLVGDKFNRANSDEDFILFMAKNISEVCKRHQLTPLFVSHVTGPSKSKDDRQISKKVAAKMKTDFSCPSMLLTGNYRPDELKGIIGLCHIFAGARMHANIAALSSGVPLLAIAYSHKTPGIMALFDQSENVAHIETLTEDEFLTGISRLLLSHTKIHTVIKKNLVTVKSEASRNLIFINNMLNT